VFPFTFLLLSCSFHSFDFKSHQVIVIRPATPATFYLFDFLSHSLGSHLRVSRRRSAKSLVNGLVNGLDSPLSYRYVRHS